MKQDKHAFYNMVETLAYHGIHVTIKKDQDVIYADLNSNTKSWMHLYPTMVVIGRYGEYEPIDGLADLLNIFVERYFPKEFGDDKWIELAVHFGFLKTETITKIVRPGEG